MPKFSPITFDEFAVKDSFVFAEEIVHHDSKLFMGSFEDDSLFTNIPFKETINICTNLLYNNVDVIKEINNSLHTKGRCGHGTTLRTDFGYFYVIIL